ncbi:MAG: hypothetical protein ACP5QK_11675 [Myxococcota bacterium]
MVIPNNHRTSQLYERVFYTLLHKCKGLTQGKKKFWFKNRPFSLDARIIELCATLYNCAKFKKTKGTPSLTCLCNGRQVYCVIF